MNTLRKTAWAVLLGVPLLGWAAPLSITVPRVIQFDKDIVVPKKVLEECQLDTYLTDALRDALRKRFDRVSSADTVTASIPGLALQLSIIDVAGNPGGMKSGSKVMTVAGTLWKDGVEVGNFVARRSAIVSNHTCNLLQRNARNIAGDIADWVKAPSLNARLGSAD